MAHSIADRLVKASNVFRQTVDSAVRFAQFTERIIVELHFSANTLTHLFMKVLKRLTLLYAIDFIFVLIAREDKLALYRFKQLKGFRDLLVDNRVMCVIKGSVVETEAVFS